MKIDGRPHCGLRTDDVLIADLLRGQPRYARHIVDQRWRLASPDTQSGRFARLWPGPAGRLAGFAAWQMPWAALDLYVRDGSHRLAVLDAAFSWAGRLFRALDADRGEALPYWLECRSDDDDTPRLAAEFNREGIGAALLGELLTRFRGLGATHAQVEAEPGNLAAIRA